MDTYNNNVGCCGVGNTNGGFLAGGGIEYAITNNWTIKAEYDFLWLKSRSVAVAYTPVIGHPVDLGNVTWNPNIQMVKVGFNYKFGGY